MIVIKIILIVLQFSFFVMCIENVGLFYGLFAQF